MREISRRRLERDDWFERRHLPDTYPVIIAKITHNEILFTCDFCSETINQSDA